MIPFSKLAYAYRLVNCKAREPEFLEKEESLEYATVDAIVSGEEWFYPY